MKKLLSELLRKPTLMSLIIRTIQLFEHSPFPGKMINYGILSIRTPTFEIIISISKHLHPCGAQTGVAKCPPAFDSLYGATARVTERLLAYYRHFRTTTTVVSKCLLDSYCHCGA